MLKIIIFFSLIKVHSSWLNITNRKARQKNTADCCLHIERSDLPGAPYIGGRGSPRLESPPLAHTQQHMEAEDVAIHHLSPLHLHRWWLGLGGLAWPAEQSPGAQVAKASRELAKLRGLPKQH